jgi:phosphatidylinositol alpha-1,6-mannosyltransferase
VLADIHAYLAESRLAETVVFLGRVDDDTLSAAYQAADAHVFPVLECDDDVEGFGMVAIEAAAHGLATVAFDAGGVADAVTDGESGVLVPSGDYSRFTEAVLGFLNARNSESRALCRAAAYRNSWDEFNRSIARAIA